MQADTIGTWLLAQLGLLAGEKPFIDRTVSSSGSPRGHPEISYG